MSAKAQQWQADAIKCSFTCLITKEHDLLWYSAPKGASFLILTHFFVKCLVGAFRSYSITSDTVQRVGLNSIFCEFQRLHTSQMVSLVQNVANWRHWNRDYVQGDHLRITERLIGQIQFHKPPNTVSEPIEPSADVTPSITRGQTEVWGLLRGPKINQKTGDLSNNPPPDQETHGNCHLMQHVLTKNLILATIEET